MSTPAEHCSACGRYFGGGSHECYESLREKAADAKAIAVDAVAEAMRLRAVLEDVLLFEPPPGAKPAWDRAWAAVRATTSAKNGADT